MEAQRMPSAQVDEGRVEQVQELLRSCGYFYKDAEGISPHLMCFCEEPFQDPVSTPCDHYFCRACIEPWINSTSPSSTCPTCRRPLLSSHLVSAPKLISSLLDDLICICPLGCGLELRRADIVKHLERECEEAERSFDGHGHDGSNGVEHVGRIETLERELRRTRAAVRRQGAELAKWKNNGMETFEALVQRLTNQPTSVSANGTMSTTGIATTSRPRDIRLGHSRSESSAGGGRRGDMAHNANCDKCRRDGIVGTRYKCMQCPDYDLCGTCYPTASTFHPRHSFFPLTDIDNPRVAHPQEFLTLHPTKHHL
ncbi:hypothetical protein BT69DRAFT_1349058 [Atractiella rhizophila]|nr:hypothetical protein BT69DRAFT_1349058 [Atractiella rhizophila]